MDKTVWSKVDPLGQGSATPILKVYRGRVWVNLNNDNKELFTKQNEFVFSGSVLLGPVLRTTTNDDGSRTCLLRLRPGAYVNYQDICGLDISLPGSEVTVLRTRGKARKPHSFVFP